MEIRHMVVYDKGRSNWSAFSPDILGCGSVGVSLDETRANMHEAMRLHLDETIKASEPVPQARTTSINFDEFDPDRKIQQYVIEWLAVSLQPRATAASGIHG